MASSAISTSSPQVHGVCRETIWLGSVCMVDLAITLYLLATGQGLEGNPIMAHFLGYGLGAFCLAKLLFVIPPLMVAEWYRRRNDRLIRATLRAVTIAYVAIWITGVVLLNSPWP